MTMIAAEGIFHFGSLADWAAKGNNGGSNVTFSKTGGRGGRGEFLVGLNANMYKVLSVARQVVFDHRAVNTSDRNGAGLLIFRSGTDTHILVRSLDDGSLEVRRLAPPFSTSADPLLPGSTVLGFSTLGVIRNGVWHQIQTKCKIDPAAGELTIYVDGIQVFTFSGNTYCGEGAQTTSMVGISGSSSGANQLSDWVVCDDQGAVYNTYLGDVAVYESVTPTDGDLTAWVRSSGAGTHSSHVNQNPQDADATYVSSAVNGDRDDYLFPTISGGIGTILAVKATICHRKEDASLGLIQIFSRSDDNVNHDGSSIACTQSYKFDERIFEKDLKDNSSWTAAKVNATRLGFKNAS